MKLNIKDLVILGLILLWAVLPDPTDAFDAFLPVLEGATALVYLFLRKKGDLKF